MILNICPGSVLCRFIILTLTLRVMNYLLCHFCSFNPSPTKLINLNFQALEVVSRYRDPQPQVLENYSYLLNWDHEFINVGI